MIRDGSPCCRIGIDDWLRVPSIQDVFAIGDCSGFLESTGKPVLPALAQVSASRCSKFGKHQLPHAIMFQLLVGSFFLLFFF